MTSRETEAGSGSDTSSPCGAFEEDGRVCSEAGSNKSAESRGTRSPKQRKRQLASYYDTVVDPLDKVKEGSDASSSDDDEFKRALILAGGAMRKALDKERKLRNGDDDHSIAHEIDLALSAIKPEEMEQEHLRGQSKPDDAAVYSQALAASTSISAAMYSQTLNPNQYDDHIKDRIKQERRVWGAADLSRNDQGRKKELDRYREAMKMRIDRLDAGNSASKARLPKGTDAAKVVKQSIMHYYKEYQVQEANGNVKHLGPEERSGLTAAIKMLRGDSTDRDYAAMDDRPSRALM